MTVLVRLFARHVCAQSVDRGYLYVFEDVIGVLGAKRAVETPLSWLGPSILNCSWLRKLSCL